MERWQSQDECTRLESEQAGNRLGGSNPSLSASKPLAWLKSLGKDIGSGPGQVRRLQRRKAKTVVEPSADGRQRTVRVDCRSKWHGMGVMTRPVLLGELAESAEGARLLSGYTAQTVSRVRIPCSPPETHGVSQTCGAPRFSNSEPSVIPFRPRLRILIKWVAQTRYFSAELAAP